MSLSVFWHAFLPLNRESKMAILNQISPPLFIRRAAWSREGKIRVERRSRNNGIYLAMYFSTYSRSTTYKISLNGGKFLCGCGCLREFGGNLIIVARRARAPRRQHNHGREADGVSVVASVCLLLNTVPSSALILFDDDDLADG